MLTSHCKHMQGPLQYRGGRDVPYAYAFGNLNMLARVIITLFLMHSISIK